MGWGLGAGGLGPFVGYLEVYSRRSKAEALVAEIRELIDGRAGSKFGIYQEEEAGFNKEMVADLKLKI